MHTAQELSPNLLWFTMREPRYLQIQAELLQIYLLHQIYVAIPGRGE